MSRFLLVSLNIDAVLQETTIHRRRQKLRAMTNGFGLGDAYGSTLGRIKRQGEEESRLGVTTLMWISHSERPLRASELCHALAVDIGSPNLNTDNVPSINTLLTCCQGLVVVDKEASTVRLIHFTFQEYLRAHPEIFGATHSTIAETCLTYLTSRQVKAFSTSPFSDLQDAPFLEYSSLYWGVHAKRDLSDCAKLLALKMFDDYNSHISTQLLFSTENPYMCPTDLNRLSLFSGLHCASFFGIVQIVAILLEMEGCDINKMDCGGNTPLGWAAWRGHEEVVELLLSREDINPDSSNEYGRTPLCLAAGSGYEGVVKILIGREDINPDSPDRYDQTPLCLAAGNGYEGVVNMLLGRGSVNPNKSDVLGRTPLHWAAGKGFEGVVKILLEQGNVNPEISDISDQTPLYLAAESGHERVVKILLRHHDVSTNKSDKYGQTPLHLAARGGYEGVVTMLLGRSDINPDRLDVLGQTAIYLAAEGGFERVVNVLLGAAYFDKLDLSGPAPLPAELGPLPLYPDDDGFYSVLGPPLSHVAHGDQANGPINNTLAYNQIKISATLSPPRNKVFCGSSYCSGYRFALPSTLALFLISTNAEKRSTHLFPSLLHL